MPNLEARLLFSGPTALARAWSILDDGGYRCAIVSAPEGATPCGMALSVRDADLGAVLAVLRALRAAPTRICGDAPVTPPPRARTPP